MGRTIVSLVAALALALPASASSSASTWRVVNSTGVSGQSATTKTSATILYPRGIAVRFVGTGVRGTARWSCRKGLRISSWSRSWGGGLHVLRHVSGKTSCHVVASIGGSGRIKVQILKWV